MKLRRRAATIPGKYKGNETLKNVPQAFSPKSLDASSSEKSKPSIRAISINIAKGVQNKV